VTRISQSQYNSSTSGTHQAGIPQQQMGRPVNVYPGIPPQIGQHQAVIMNQRPSNVNINMGNIPNIHNANTNINVVQSLNRGPIMRY
jgi:hypothetical protein